MQSVGHRMLSGMKAGLFQSRQSDGLRRIACVFAAVAAGLTASACGESAVPGASTTPASHPGVVRPSDLSTVVQAPLPAVSSLQTARDYAGASVHFDPPGAAVAAVAPGALVAQCGTHPACYDLTLSAACSTGSPAKIELGKVTQTLGGASGTLAWAMSWPHVDCMAMGPRPTTEPSSFRTGCEWVAFIDATTGKFIAAILGPFPQ